MLTRLIAALILCAAVPAALASEGKGVLFDEIRAQQAEIRAGVETRSGRYKAMDNDTRSELLRRQGQVLAAIEGKQVPADLDAQQRTTVFNHLEWIEAAINRTQDERLVCEYTRTIGSNRKTRVCRTEEQLREERERARLELDRRPIRGR